MGRKGNPAVVGAFVIGAVAIIVIAIVALGSGTLFKKTHPAIAYFSGSVNGLYNGALVKFRGVQIGEVTGISLLLADASDDGEPRIGVLFEIDGDRIARLGGQQTEQLSEREGMERAVARGLRAQLQSESILTGVLFVDLDMKPDTPATLVLGDKAPVPEIPTIPTALEQAQQLFQEALQALKGVDVRAIALAVKDAAQGFAKVVNSPEIPRIVSGAEETLVDVQKLIQRLDKRVDPLANDLGATTAEVRRTLASVDQTLKTLQGTLAPDSPVPVEMSRALQQLGDAARAVRDLADVLERHPNSVLFGKP